MAERLSLRDAVKIAARVAPNLALLALTACAVPFPETNPQPEQPTSLIGYDLNELRPELAGPVEQSSLVEIPRSLRLFISNPSLENWRQQTMNDGNQVQIVNYSDGRAVGEVTSPIGLRVRYFPEASGTWDYDPQGETGKTVNWQRAVSVWKNDSVQEEWVDIGDEQPRFMALWQNQEHHIKVLARPEEYRQIWAWEGPNKLTLIQASKSL